MKKANLLTVALLVYLVVIAVIAFPRYKENGEWLKYFAVIFGQVVIVFLLRYFTLKRDQMLKSKTNGSIADQNKADHDKKD